MSFRHCLALLFILVSSELRAQDLRFNGQDFVYVWGAKEGNVTLSEHLPSGSTLENWIEMITFQCHPFAREVKDVTGPYYEARANLVAMRPEATKNESEFEEDVNLVLFLGSPMSTHIEFVIARFVRDSDMGVLVAVFSRKFEAAEEVNVTVAIENKEQWVDELSAIPPDSIRSFCGAVKK